MGGALSKRASANAQERVHAKELPACSPDYGAFVERTVCDFIGNRGYAVPGSAGYQVKTAADDQEYCAEDGDSLTRCQTFRSDRHNREGHKTSQKPPSPSTQQHGRFRQRELHSIYPSEWSAALDEQVVRNRETHGHNQP